MPIARLLAVALLSLGAPLARADSLVLLTENLAPFNMSTSGGNFAKDDAVKGISADVLRLTCQRAGIDCKMILRFPWDRVYQQALKEPGYGVFSTARTPERETLFKWVGPIASNDWVLLARADSPITLSNLQDAAKYRIGGYKGDAIGQHLIDRGLAVESSLRDNENVKKLEKGQIDLWVTADPSGPYMARQEGFKDVKVAYRFRTAELYLALNKDTPDEWVRKLQGALDALRAEGALQKVNADYR